MHAQKFVKSERFLAVLREILLSMSSKLRFIKLMRFFERNSIVKIVKTVKTVKTVL